MPSIPFIALTATATQRLLIECLYCSNPLFFTANKYIFFRVQQDIKDSLFLQQPYIFVGSFDRPNLFYGVHLIKQGVDRDESIIEMLRDVPRRVSLRESTIIYCATVRDTEKASIPTGFQKN